MKTHDLQGRSFNSLIQWLLGCSSLYIGQILLMLTLILMCVITGVHVLDTVSRFCRLHTGSPPNPSLRYKTLGSAPAPDEAPSRTGTPGNITKQLAA
jgi:hypothetical protein